MTERSQVQWGTTAIAYSVQRSPRRRTVSIAVDPSGSVVLTAPVSTPLLRLDRLVHDRARWIVERVRRRSDRAPAVTRQFVSGETVMYLGRSYRLQVREGAEPTAATLAGGRLQLTVSSGLGEPERRAAVRASVIGWLRRHAADRLPERVAWWAGRLRIDPPEVRLREQQRRWGSCDAAGTVRLNWRIVQAPMRLVDYVVAHELQHLRHTDHSAAFWAALGRVMPDYEQRRQELVRRGATYVW